MHTVPSAVRSVSKVPWKELRVLCQLWFFGFVLLCTAMYCSCAMNPEPEMGCRWAASLLSWREEVCCHQSTGKMMFFGNTMKQLQGYISKVVWCILWRHGRVHCWGPPLSEAAMRACAKQCRTCLMETFSKHTDILFAWQFLQSRIIVKVPWVCLQTLCASGWIWARVGDNRFQSPGSTDYMAHFYLLSEARVLSSVASAMAHIVPVQCGPNMKRTETSIQVLPSGLNPQQNGLSQQPNQQQSPFQSCVSCPDFVCAALSKRDCDFRHQRQISHPFFCATGAHKTGEIVEQGKHGTLCRILRTASDDSSTLFVPNHESLEDMQKRCENLLARIHKESEASRVGGSRRLTPLRKINKFQNSEHCGDGRTRCVSFKSSASCLPGEFRAVKSQSWGRGDVQKAIWTGSTAPHERDWSWRFLDVFGPDKSCRTFTRNEQIMDLWRTTISVLAKSLSGWCRWQLCVHRSISRQRNSTNWSWPLWFWKQESCMFCPEYGCQCLG